MLQFVYFEFYQVFLLYFEAVLLGAQFSSVTQSCPTLCDPMNCSTPGLPVHHQLPVFTHTQIDWVSDAIQPSHPLSSPSPPAPNPSQHQGLFQWSQLFTWGGQSTGVSASASFLPKKSQGWSPSEWTAWISLQSKGLSRVFSKKTRAVGSYILVSDLGLLSPPLTLSHDLRTLSNLSEPVSSLLKWI